jgi:hypothetical protein
MMFKRILAKSGVSSFTLISWVVAAEVAGLARMLFADRIGGRIPGFVLFFCVYLLVVVAAHVIRNRIMRRDSQGDQKRSL